MNQVNFDKAGGSNQPSPSIWKDCLGEEMNEVGTGYYKHFDFNGSPLVNTTITSALLARLNVADGLSNDGDDDTVLTQKSGEIGGYLDIETDGDDNDAFAMFTEPLGAMVLNSGNKFWFEARFEVGALADQGVFIGLAEKAALSRDIVADNCGALIGESLIGFQILADDTDGADAVFKLDNGTVVEMKSDVTQASALSTTFHLVADTEVKLGMKFDGKDQIQIFVNGTKVSTYTITPSTFPKGVNFGGIIAVKTGTAAAQSISVDWFRVAVDNHR